MSAGPDGPAERLAYEQEQSLDDTARLDSLEDLADTQNDTFESDLLDLAEARMTGFWLEKIIGDK
jgi:hypothetical protein